MAKRSNNLSGRRSSSHNTKPYDTNNSFVKKVATKVTDLLPQRLWISKWFNTSQNDEDILEDNGNPEEVESEEDIQKPPPIKRPCIRMDVSHPPGTFSIQPRTKSTINKASPSKQQYFIHDETNEDFSKPAMAGPSGMSHLVSSTPATQSDIRNIAPQSESTSCCSSLIPQTNRQEAPSNVSYSSPFSKRKRFNDKLNFNNTRDSLSSRRPSFNASIMTNTQDRASALASPFYSGNTTFGGANAAGLYKRGRNLFNSSNEIQLQVPKRTSVEVKPSNTDSSGMSQTAKKILEALEHFSSPITDAKKIPLKMMNNISPTNKKRSREEMTSTTKVGLRHLTRELTVPTIPDILKLRRRQKLQDTTAAARKIVSARSEPPPPQEYHLRTQIDEDSKHHGKIKTKAANLEQEDTVEPVNLPNIPLPISSLPNFNFMSSTNTNIGDKSNTGEEDTFTFASPIKVTNTTKNLKSINNFTFSSPISADKESVDKSSNSDSPLKRVGVKSTSSNDYVPPVTQNFIWSGSSTAPRLKEKIKNNDKTIPITSNELKSGSVMDILCSKSSTTKAEKSDESKTQLESNKESTNNKTNAIDKVIIESVRNVQSNIQDTSIMWECSECLFKNNNSETQCFACKITRPSFKDKKTSELSISSNVSESKTTANDNFGSQFKLSSNQWECTSCFVRNKQTDTKCAACSALKPDTKQETKSGNCPKCRLNDSENPTMCTFCNTSKSSILKMSVQDSTNPTDNTNISVCQNIINASIDENEDMDKLNSNKDTWECPCCMVRNLISIDSCPCCNTAKPSTGIATKNASPLFSNGFGDKFKKPEGAWICNTCMLQNETKVTTCVACGDAKPGSTKPDNSTSTNTNSNLQFNFDMPANTSGFKFGIDKADQEKTDTTISTNGFKFGEKQQSNQTGQFTFGIQKEDTKTSEVQKSDNNVSLTSGSGFGVPNKVNNAEKTDVKQDSENVGKSSTPLFSFGIAKSENGTIESDKQIVNVTTSTSIAPTFTFNMPKPRIEQTDIKEEKQTPLLESTVAGASKPNIEVIESTTTNTNTLPSVTQSSIQEPKSTAAFSFVVPSSTSTITSSASTTVVSSLPSSTQSSFTFLESKSTTQAPAVPTFGQISTSAPTSNLSNTFTFGNSETKEESSITKTFSTLPNASPGSSLFSSISSAPSLFGNNDTKTVPAFGQTSTEDNKQPAFGAANTSKSSTFVVPGNKVPIFGNTENKPKIFGSTDPKLSVFGNTDNKPTSLFNPSLQAQTATPVSFGASSATSTLFGSSATPVFGNNTASSFTTESTPNIFGSTSKSNETSTPNSNIFTFGTTPAQPIAKPATGFNFSTNTNPAESTQKPLFTFGSHSSAQKNANLFGNTFNNPASTNSSGFLFNAPKPEASAFGQPTATNPIFGASQPGTQNQASSSFSSTPSNTGFNFGSTAPVVTSGGFNFGTASASTPSAGFNFNAPGTTPTFDPNTPPTFNFTGGNAPVAFKAIPTQTPQRKFKKAIRRMR
ncbi:nuclear pore complex protein Nup153 isoform X4 [Bombus vosnesenskii]|uniref:Nuclear pore complex protein Nup153 n=1 Tax=Bombus vosnesenskii TaxID=207650 RepID=A0A6J3KT43_9HYME|nr:nuclear pore complex protein Nup153 isoform X4 [Bombus vosnesenskii]